MLSVASAGVEAPLVKDGRARKYTLDNIARIKEWVAQGVGRDEIASRLEVTVGSLQVTCSRLGISLRTNSSAKGSGASEPPGAVRRSIERIRQNDVPARPKFLLLIQKQNRQAAFDLPLRQDLIEQLALEAAVHGQTIADVIGTIVRQATEKDFVGEILSNRNPPLRPSTCK